MNVDALPYIQTFLLAMIVVAMVLKETDDMQSNDHALLSFFFMLVVLIGFTAVILAVPVAAYAGYVYLAK